MFSEPPPKPQVHLISTTSGVTHEEWFTSMTEQHIQVGRPPQFVEGIPQTMEIRPDDNVINVEVLVDAEPAVTEFTWFVNDQRLTASVTVKLRHVGNRASLHISKEAMDMNVQNGDELTVVAKNQLGVATSGGRVFIQSKHLEYKM